MLRFLAHTKDNHHALGLENWLDLCGLHRSVDAVKVYLQTIDPESLWNQGKIPDLCNSVL